jgi:hypothetical protein
VGQILRRTELPVEPLVVRPETLARRLGEGHPLFVRALLDAPGLESARMAWGSDAVAELLRRLDLGYVALYPGATPCGWCDRGLHNRLVNYLGNRDPLDPARLP